MKKNISKIITLTMLSIALVSTIANAATYSGTYNGEIGTEFNIKKYVPYDTTTFFIYPTSGQGYIRISDENGNIKYEAYSYSSTGRNASMLLYKNGVFKASTQSRTAYGSARLNDVY